MKTKLFSILTLLLCLCMVGNVSAWAAETTVVFKSTTNDDSGNALSNLSSGGTVLVGSGLAKFIATNSNALGTSANKYGYRADRANIVFKLNGTTDLTICHNANSTGERYMQLYSFSSENDLEDITSSDWSTKTIQAFTSTNSSTTWENGQSSVVTTNDAKTTWNYTTKGCLTVTWEDLPAGYYVLIGTGSEAYIYSFTADVAAATVPDSPTFSPDGGSVEGLSTVTITSSASKVYYQWSDTEVELTTASEGWSTGKSVEVPNETATKYLYAYASNGTGLNSNVVHKAFTITAISRFTWGLTQDDLTTSAAISTTTTYTGSDISSFTASSASMGSSSSTRSLTNGTSNVTAAKAACQRNNLCASASDFVEASYYGFTMTIASGYKLNISQFFGDLYYDSSRSGKYKFAVYSGDTKVWEAGSSDYVTLGGSNNSQKTLDVSEVDALQGLTGTVQMRMVWYQGGSSSYVALKDFNITASIEEDTRTTYTLSATASPAAGGTISFDPVGGSYEEGDEVTLTATPNDGYYFVNWTDDNNSDAEVATTAAYTHTMEAEAAAFTAHFAKYPVITFSKGETAATGTVPSATYTSTGSYTVPVNNSLSISGKTLTAWNDGTNDYAIGTTINSITSDITLTPVFTDNAFELNEIPETTVSFPFTQNGGAPVMAAEGGTTMRVAQATVGSDFVDVLMSVDASSGKFNNNQGNLDACQINATTTITLPAVSGMTVTINKAFSTSYLGEDTNTGTTESGSTTWTYTGDASTVTLTINESDRYPTLMTVVYPAATETATIAASGWTSLASVLPLDFANAEDASSNKNLKAYVISNITSSAVTLTSVESAPAETGLILKGTASTAYTIPVSASPASITTNELSAAVTATAVEAESVYVVSGGQLKLFEGTSIPAGKAYLLKSKVDAVGARSLSFIFDDETTGISNVENAQRQLLSGDFYNLAGQRVAAPAKGMYIVNGRKVVIK